ncbi:MAG: zinc-binding alcohol dehydrogenase family protein [Bacteroidaceae bacterium]|nr:zinc-binding alcohol dehydrogenase family protein [Bacteroidaceae bacterium]
MKALQITNPHKLEVIDLPQPSPASDEVLLRIQYVGFCGSDLNTFRGRNALALNPVIPGHEISATIEEIGPAVPDGLRIGQIVTVNPYTACGTCPSCRRRRPNACQYNQTLGVQRQGAMCQWLCVPWQKVIPADGLSLHDVALVEPMSVGFHAVDRGQVTDSDTVLVIGCGMIGVGAIVRAILRGATVIAADIDDEKLALAGRLGATATINTASGDCHTRLQELTRGAGPDVIIEAVGSAATYALAVGEVSFTGRIVCIGYAPGDVSLPTRLFVQKELDVRGSRNALPDDFRAAIRYLRRGECPTDSLISAVVRPEEAARAMAGWDAAPGRVFRIIVDFS